MPDFNNFKSWYNDIDDIKDKGILQVKNGLEYEIALTLTKKPEFKKQKSQFAVQRKKYEVTGVDLIDVKIADQKEIDNIITEDGTQEARYEQINELQKDTTYMLKLTEQQYKSMTNFMSNNKIELNQNFFFRRFGKRLNTYFKFYLKSQIKKNVQKIIDKKGATK